MDTAKRSLLKTLTWRVTGSSAVFIISFIFTGNLGLAGSIAAVQLITNTILYYFHERCWNKIGWGRS